MTLKLHRREMILCAGAFGLSSCVQSSDFTALDASALQVKEILFQNNPDAARAAQNAAGYIVFPKITKAGFFVGANLGEGTLYSKNNVIGHYSVRAVSAGLQAGLETFSMMLFFMTPEAMAKFRQSSGFELAMDIEYTLPNYGSMDIGASSNTYRRPVYALIFNQTGVMVGASLEGAIYTAI